LFQSFFYAGTIPHDKAQDKGSGLNSPAEFIGTKRPFHLKRNLTAEIALNDV
jgi:hypothetical protein